MPRSILIQKCYEDCKRLSQRRGGVKQIVTQSTGERTTPDWLFKALDDIFHFDVDAAATAENAKCRVYFSKAGIDALAVDWDDYGKSFFCNPPFDRGQLRRWLIQARSAAQWQDTRTAVILPADLSTGWSDIPWNSARYLAFLKGRIKFNGMSTGAKQPTMIAVFEKLGSRVDYSLVAQLEKIGKGARVHIN